MSKKVWEETKCERVVSDTGKANLLGKCTRIVGSGRRSFGVYNHDLEATRHRIRPVCHCPGNN